MKSSSLASSEKESHLCKKSLFPRLTSILRLPAAKRITNFSETDFSLPLVLYLEALSNSKFIGNDRNVLWPEVTALRELLFLVSTVPSCQRHNAADKI